MLFELKKKSQNGVIDYRLLMSCLNHYKAPHRKITELLKSGDLIRIKKGLYILAEEHRDKPINRVLLANLIFGPSYVSQEYALQYHGLIPERVEVVTSMTTKRRKDFNTPLGRFLYSYLNPQRYTVGIDWSVIDDDAHVLIASPEKAIADTINKFRDIKTELDMSAHLIENMRIDESILKELDLRRLSKIRDAYRSPVISLFYRTLSRGV